MSTFASSRSPKYWTKPEEFNPYRFDDEEQLKRYIVLLFTGWLGVFAHANCYVTFDSNTLVRLNENLSTILFLCVMFYVRH